MAGKTDKGADVAQDAQDTAQDAPQDAGPADLLLAGETVDPRTLAALMRDPAGTHRWALGRDVSDKRVRSVARDTITRFVERTGYTAHAYTQDEADALYAAMQGRGRGAATTNAATLRERAAGKGGAA